MRADNSVATDLLRNTRCCGFLRESRRYVRASKKRREWPYLASCAVRPQINWPIRIDVPSGRSRRYCIVFQIPGVADELDGVDSSVRIGSGSRHRGHDIIEPASPFIYRKKTIE